jgi:hypothetical protein
MTRRPSATPATAQPEKVGDFPSAERVVQSSRATNASMVTVMESMFRPGTTRKTARNAWTQAAIARLMLAAVVPFDDWKAMAPWTEAEIATYEHIVERLKAMCRGRDANKRKITHRVNF